MNTITLTLNTELMQLLQSAFASVLNGEQSAAQITLTCDDDRLIEIILTGDDLDENI